MRCERAGCGGSIVDGYCDTCWLAPAAPRAAAPTDVVQPAPTASRTNGVTRTRQTQTSTKRASRFGGGLVELPAVPVRDPAAALLADPEVPERRRFCANQACREPVGRSRDGRPGRAKGFCAKCGTPFRFTPTLQPGDLVAGQYEIAGCLAHGGQGWVYLACDRAVDARWVVLKGLLDTGDADALAAALAERRFLAHVEHPNIVKIHNFVEHAGDGYIVMEFVDGVSLRQTLDARREANGGEPDPLPAELAIAYILELLPALGHLHERGLAYCDLKPDNVIRTERSVKLIDLGAVYRFDDETSRVYGTGGYLAPEIEHTGPTVASDLFTVGRTLAVLCTDFVGLHGTDRHALRTPDEVPLYAEQESLYRFLLRATAADPADRFESAEAMATQLLGVLRQVVSARTGEPAPGTSTSFTAPPPARAAGGRPSWRALPMLTVDPGDPAAATIISLGGLAAGEALERLARSPVTTVEMRLWRVRLLVELGDLDSADAQLGTVAADDPWDWRVRWYGGIVALERGDHDSAGRHFDAVHGDVPGELAPIVAMGIAAELRGEHRTAVRWYESVSRTDHAFTVAALGLARCRAALGDRDGAIEAYGRVPETSSAYVDACVAQLDLLVAAADRAVTAAELHRAGQLVERVPVDDARRERLRLPVLEAALAALTDGGLGADVTSVLGVELDERSVRFALERGYREVARQAGTNRERVALVDRANAVRPRTLL